MNNIYKPRFPHDTRIDEKFATFRLKIQHLLDIPLVDNNDLMTAIKFTGQPENFQDLDASISLDNLSHPDDLRISDYDPAKPARRKKSPTLPKEAMSLQTISTLVAQKDVFTDGHYLRYVKYNKHRHISLNVDNSQPDILPGEETLVVVRVYEPFK